ncbi:MAG: hypothetical protein AB7E49_04865 [Campylobacterales bacterium]
MKKAILFFSAALVALACSGDCMSCHPALVANIQQDTHHRVMLECIQCHKESTNPDAPCGGNCFACHAPSSIPQQIPQHASLNECRSCHITAKDSSYLDKLFDFGGNQGGVMVPLNQILNAPAAQ